MKSRFQTAGFHLSLKFLIFNSLMFFCIAVNAQVKTPQQKADSLVSVYQNHTRDDSAKLVIVKQVYKQFMKLKNFDKSEVYVNKTIALANKIDQKKYAGDAYYNLGLFYHGFANYIKAEGNYYKAIEVYTAMNNLDMVGGTYLNLGALYNGIPDYAKALEANQKAIPIYLELKSEGDLASCYVNVAEIYQSLDQQVEAYNYLQKALKVFGVGNQSNRGLAVVYNMLGSTFIQATETELTKLGIASNQKYNKALEYLAKGLKVAEDLKDASVLGPIYQDLGTVYEASGNKDLALKSYLKATEYNNKQDDKSYYAISLLALSDFYTKENEYEKATSLLLEALKIAQQNKLLEVQRNAYQKLSTIEEKQGNFNQSLVYYRLYISFKDQIFNKEKENEITRRQLQLDFSIKENDYQLKQKITDVELQRQVFLARQQQQQLTLRKQELALSDKEKSLQRITFLKRQSDLENEKSVLDKQRLFALLAKAEKEKEIDLQSNELRVNKNVNTFLVVLATILFLSGAFVFYTQRKTARLNRIVSEQKRELENLSKVKDTIFSVVSHDMRSPVNSLISFIQLLEDGNISQGELTRYAGNLKNTLGYTSSMMENLLNWASSQMQGFEPIIEKFDIQLCIQEVLNSMLTIANQKGITIKNNIPSGTLCLADMNMTSLIVRNLISNAIKFTPNNGVIELNSIKDGKKVKISIMDNGIGMPTEQVVNFNTSTHLETGKSTYGTNKEKGTGIGLVLCKTFTKMMNGSLQANSKLNNGSVFTLSLPKAV
ncbi:tetratricopeptide repeat protein [Pedobacter frigiditerrae]|uniref:tetratricopeptide repeat-containing sensor histidine kinase n=1 Tax=Pedobacter frigiditerrae TaxID=2530452 RepID=UPI00292D5FDC|nr:tetratricopeptide repeat protein [Pedobacter frigiditerrae]